MIFLSEVAVLFGLHFILHKCKEFLIENCGSSATGTFLPKMAKNAPAVAEFPQFSIRSKIQFAEISIFWLNIPQTHQLMKLQSLSFQKLDRKTYACCRVTLYVWKNNIFSDEQRLCSVLNSFVEYDLKRSYYKERDENLGKVHHKTFVSLSHLHKH